MLVFTSAELLNAKGEICGLPPYAPNNAARRMGHPASLAGSVLSQSELQKPCIASTVNAEYSLVCNAFADRIILTALQLTCRLAELLTR
jgi:hypothetical protein